MFLKVNLNFLLKPIKGQFFAVKGPSLALESLIYRVAIGGFIKSFKVKIFKWSKPYE